MTPTLLSYRIEAGSKGYGFMSYQPNLVARQFGLSQMVLKPLVSHVIDIMWFGRSLNVDDHKACLRFCKSTQRYELPVFKFQQSFLTIVDFDEWWATYQSHAFPSDQFLQNMIDYVSLITDNIPPLSPPVNAADHIIQTHNADEAPRKVYVTNFISSFPMDVKIESFRYQGRKRVVPSSKPALAKPSKKQRAPSTPNS